MLQMRCNAEHLSWVLKGKWQRLIGPPLGPQSCSFAVLSTRWTLETTSTLNMGEYIHNHVLHIPELFTCVMVPTLIL